MIGRLNHVAIAVKDLAAASATYADMLGAHVGAPFAQPEHGVTVVFIELPNTKIELLEPLGVMKWRIFMRRGIICWPKVRGFLGMEPPKSAHMASPCCFCIRRILMARWWNWNRFEPFRCP